MKSLKSIILLGMGVAALSLTSCENWLDVNTDPDNPSAEGALYKQRLSHIEFYTNSSHQFAAWRNNFACGDWTRYNGGGTYQNMSVWYPAAGITTTPYQWWFVGAYANVPDMIEKAMADENYQYAGVGYAIKAYGMMLMTDLYGEMPYTEAIGENAIPKYDNGKTIFLGCLKDIDTAIDLLEKGRSQSAALPSLAEGDFWNNGDLEKWIKLAYLWKARWINHLVKKGAGSYLDGKYDAETILACLNKAQQSNADNTIINHTDENSPSHDVLGWDEPVDYSPLYSVSGMNAGYYVTKMYYDVLTNFDGKGIEDPRADRIIPWAWSAKSENTPKEIKWNGNWRRSMGVDMQSGIHGAGGPLRAQYNATKHWYIDSTNPERLNDTIYVEQTSESKGFAAKQDLLYRRNGTDASKESGTFYTRVSSPTYVGTYAEACFIKAEVLFNKGDKNGAFEAYKNGIKASIDLMNDKLNVWIGEDMTLLNCPSFVPMENADIDNFLNNAIGTSADITLSKIMMQKRVAMFFDMETWNDMRKYDYDSKIFTGWAIPAYHFLSEGAMKAIPAGKDFRRWQQCSHELNYNADNLQAIGAEVPGADMSKKWNAADDVWTIPVWWDSTQN